MKKTCKTLLVSGALMMACALPMQAASTDVNLEVNGVPIEANAETGAPYISDNGRTMLPVRLISELAGCDVVYENGTVHVTNEKLSLEAVFVNGQNTCTINGETVVLDEPMTISAEGRAYVPVRALAESFADVEWVNDTRTVKVTIEAPVVDPSKSDWTLSLSAGTTSETSDQLFVVATNTKTGQSVLLSGAEKAFGEYFNAENKNEYYPGTTKVIDGQVYLTVGRGGVMGGFEVNIFALPDVAAGQTELSYVGTIPYKSDYTVVNGYLYFTDGTNQGPWDVDPNALYLATVGDTTNKVKLHANVAVNDCALSVEDGMLIATAPDGTRHEVSRVPEAEGSIDPAHMQKVLDENTTLEGFLASDDMLSFDEIAVLPGSSISEEGGN